MEAKYSPQFLQVLDGSVSCKLRHAKSYGRPDGYLAADHGKMTLLIAFLTNTHGYLAIGSLIETVTPSCFVCLKGRGPGRNLSSLDIKN